MSKFKVGDFVIIKATIGGDNDIRRVLDSMYVHGQRMVICRLSGDTYRFENELWLWNPKTDLEGRYKMKKFEIGKVYKTENGCDAHILHVNAFGQFEGILKYDGKSGAILTTWDKNGYCISGLDLKDEYKLVREVEMKYEISMNKKYKTRDGLDVEIITIRGELFRPVVGILNGNSLVCWHSDGSITRLDEDDNDLIEVNSYADFKVDDKVLVRCKDSDTWRKRHFAYIDEQGRPVVYKAGLTSFTSKSNPVAEWYQCIKWEDRTDDMVICDD